MTTAVTSRRTGPVHSPGPPDPAARDREQEARLLARLRTGDELACASVVDAYGSRMFAVAQRLLSCPEDSADAVQDALLAAFRHIHAFKGNSTFWTWLRRILLNTCLMKRRARARRHMASLADVLAPDEAYGRQALPGRQAMEPADARAVRAETQAQVRASIDRLPDPYRAVLLLRDIEERDTDETARLLRISRGAVRVRLHRARQALRSILESLPRAEEAESAARGLPLAGG